MTFSSHSYTRVAAKNSVRAFRQAGRTLVLLSVVALSACGGGQGPSANVDAGKTAEPVNSFTATTEALPSAQTIALQKEGGRLNSEELAQIAKTGVLPEPFDGKLLSGAASEPVQEEGGSAEAKSLGQAKSAASRVPVYRFFNNRTTAHFFTTSTTERDNVQATLAYMSYEGPAFYSSATTIPGLSPVHRFYNTQTGVHFYTISEAERANVVANLPQFNYEGIAYHASTLAGTGYTPLYRFFYASKGFHFYTNSLGERDNIIATLPQYSYEGVGYYVLGSDWQTPAVPHTGVTTLCYESGRTDVVTDCTTANVHALNDQQDAHRIAINALSYSAVEAYPLTSCVKDNVTGLIWEGKEATGPRAGTLTFTNLGNSGAGDASAYRSLVNAQSLCGFNDWRLPTVEELHGLLNFGSAPGSPRISVASFPNTASSFHWTVDPDASDAVNRAWLVYFDGGNAGTSSRAVPFSVRLVRGAPWVGTRYVIGTESYPGDGANNTVLDRKTGLSWRRCLQGQAWDGNTCTGTPSTYLHGAALSHAKNQTGWRLPNIKELGSLVDRTSQSPAQDQTVFPGSAPQYLWSTTPSWSSGYAWAVVVDKGELYDHYRLNDMSIRLVRSSQ